MACPLPRHAHRGELVPVELRGVQRVIDRGGIRAEGRDWMILVCRRLVRLARGGDVT